MLETVQRSMSRWQVFIIMLQEKWLKIYGMSNLEKQRSCNLISSHNWTIIWKNWNILYSVKYKRPADFNSWKTFSDCVVSAGEWTCRQRGALAHWRQEFCLSGMLQKRFREQVGRGFLDAAWYCDLKFISLWQPMFSALISQSWWNSWWIACCLW